MINAVESSMGLHRIMCRNTLDQGLFFYVRGAVRANPAVSVTSAIYDFCLEYEITCDTEVMKTKYYRMLREYLGENQKFKEQISTAI